MKISFLGDISLNDNYNDLYQSKKNPFKEIKQDISFSDLVIGNLECVAKVRKSRNLSKRPFLSTNYDTLNYLNDMNINMVTLANNHIYDYLLDGYTSTINFLDKHNIENIGTKLLNEKKINENFIKQINDLRFCFLNYVSRDTNLNLPSTAEIVVNELNCDTIINNINKNKSKVDYIIVLLHWGGETENGYYPKFEQTKVARKLIDSGADLLIGHHSHTFQPYEIYKGKYIFYSLGNFCFSDIYQDGTLYSRLSSAQKKSIILEVDFKKNKNYEVRIIPIKNLNGYIKINKSKLCFVIFFLRNVFFKLYKNSFLLRKIYYFKLKKINPIFNYIFVQKRSFLKILNFKKIINHFLG